MIRNEDISPGRDAKLGYTNYAPVIKKVDDHTVQFIFDDQTAGFLDDTATYLIGAWTLHGRGASATFGPSHWLKQHHRDFVDDKDAFDKTVADAGIRELGPLLQGQVRQPQVSRPSHHRSLGSDQPEHRRDLGV